MSTRRSFLKSLAIAAVSAPLLVRAAIEKPIGLTTQGMADMLANWKQASRYTNHYTDEYSNLLNEIYAEAPRRSGKSNAVLDNQIQMLCDRKTAKRLREIGRTIGRT